MRKKVILIIFFLLSVFIINSFANTIEIEVNYNLPIELSLNYNNTEEMKILSNEYLKIITDSNEFDKKFYNKLNKFIINNKTSVDSLSAIYMIIGMCLLDEAYEVYSTSAEKLTDYLINNFSKYIQGKIAILLKATLLERKGLAQEAIQLLEKNYEVILSVEKDPSFYRFLDELNINNNDNKYIMAGYYYKLANIFSKFNDTKNANAYFNKVINQYPETNFAKDAKDKLK